MKYVEMLQKFLNASGVYPQLVIDGDFGPKTRGAIDTLRVPHYVKRALNEVGVREIVGSRHSQRVLEYQATTTGKYSNDEVPWCGAFVNWVMRGDGYTTVSYPERAKSWLNFGISTEDPVLGAISIKSRHGGGHVCIVIGKDIEGRLLCVGGNQSNAVNIRAYDPKVFIEFRVPKDYSEHYAMNIYDLNGDHGTQEA